MRAALLERLYRLVPRGAELGLPRMMGACARFGHPEAAFAAVHVAGTNGKGSTCAFVEAMTREAGLRTGLYTSPHLVRFAERIRVAGEPLADAVLEPLLARVLDGAPELTFFEATTLAAFVAFAEAKVELAAVEVGLGGRLDATNVLPAPRATAITRVALDHTELLGTDLASIAREKAGIAKRGVPLVLGPLDDEARAAVAEVASAVGAPLVFAEDDAAARALVHRAHPSLEGAHQVDNAMVAVVLARMAGLPDSAIEAGLRSAAWPARLETLATPGGPVLLDCAHNPDGARALGEHLDARGLEPHEVALVFGAMADKRWVEMLAMLAPRAAHRVYVEPGGRKAAPPEALAAAIPGDVAGSVREALDRARMLVGEDGLVVVAGSIFLAGEARALLLGLERDPPVAL